MCTYNINQHTFFMPRSLPPSLWWNSFWPHAGTSITPVLCAFFSSFSPTWALIRHNLWRAVEVAKSGPSESKGCDLSDFPPLSQVVWMYKELFLFVRSIPQFHARRDEQEGRSLTRSTKATASQIALLIQSRRTLFIHYLFPGSAIIAGHCQER